MLTGTINPTTKFITTVIDGSVYQVSSDHPYYNLMQQAFKDDDKDLFVEAYHKKEEVKQKIINKVESGGNIEFRDNKVFYKGVEQHHSFVDRIIAAATEGYKTVTPMLNLFENLLQNSSSRSVEEAPDFLVNKNLPITEDGCFLAYKTVTSNWYSKRSGNLTLLSGKTNDQGHIYNGIGEVIECPRNEVDDERGNECSHGLHVGGLRYSGPGGSYNRPGDRVVIVKVNPRDIVSVPKDYNAQKVRVCKYEVIGEFKEALSSTYHDIQLTADDLQVYDRVSFDYQGKNDSQPKRRYLLVEDLDESHIYGTVQALDPSYEYGDEYRNFAKDRMTNISKL